MPSNILNLQESVAGLAHRLRTRAIGVLLRFTNAMLPVAVTALFATLSGCTSASIDSDEAQAQREKDGTAVKTQVAELIAEFDADASWQQLLDEFGLFTVDLERALLDAPIQNRVLFGTLEDVESDGDGFVLTVASIDSFVEVHLRLRCDEEMIAAILDMPLAERGFLNVVVVFRASEVHRPFSIDAESDEPYVAYPTLGIGSLIVVTGDCVAIMATRDHYLSLSDFDQDH